MDKTENIFEKGQVLLINKPLSWTSFDAVKKIRSLTRVKKVGHAGTLDPLATGLLIVCTGKFTKKISEYMAAEKEYTGTMVLGAVTPTYDLESEPIDFKPVGTIDQTELLSTAHSFEGTISQVPPLHSAIKKDGKRLYEMARKGSDFEPEPRTVQIRLFEITSVELPKVDFRVVCSTGTYIRSLVHDFGKKLGCGAYLSGLCRTRIGSFRLEEAVSMDELPVLIQQRLEDQKG